MAHFGKISDLSLPPPDVYASSWALRDVESSCRRENEYLSLIFPSPPEIRGDLKIVRNFKLFDDRQHKDPTLPLS